MISKIHNYWGVEVGGCRRVLIRRHRAENCESPVLNIGRALDYEIFGDLRKP